MAPRVKEKNFFKEKVKSELDVFRSVTNRQNQQELQQLRQIRANNPNSQFFWLDGQILNMQTPVWLVFGRMPNFYRRQVWVLGRLSLIDRRLRRVPQTGMILWKRQALDSIDVEMWLVSGDLPFVQHVVWISNSQRVDSEAPLVIIGRICFGDPDNRSADGDAANNRSVQRNRAHQVPSATRNGLPTTTMTPPPQAIVERRRLSDFVIDAVIIMMIPFFIILAIVFYPKDKLKRRCSRKN